MDQSDVIEGSTRIATNVANAIYKLLLDKFFLANLRYRQTSGYSFFFLSQF